MFLIPKFPAMTKYLKQWKSSVMSSRKIANTISLDIVLRRTALAVFLVSGCGVSESVTTDEQQSLGSVEIQLNTPAASTELRNCFHCEMVCKPNGRRCCDYNSSGHAVNCKWYPCGISWNC